jgi:hypothetical protein
VKIGIEVKQGCCLSPILFNLYSEYFTKEVLKGFGDFKIGGQVIRTVKYADDLVLVVREEKVLQGMVDRLIEIGRHYRMEINVEKTKVMRLYFLFTVHYGNRNHSSTNNCTCAVVGRRVISKVMRISCNHTQ